MSPSIIFHKGKGLMGFSLNQTPYLWEAQELAVFLTIQEHPRKVHLQKPEDQVARTNAEKHLQHL